jgi:type I restriction enzyme, S subunit
MNTRLEWQRTILEHLVNYRKGFAFKSSVYANSGHPIVRVSNFTDRSIDMRDSSYIHPSKAKEYKSVQLKAGDVIIATVGSWPANPASVVGKTVRVPIEANNALLNQNTVRLRSNGSIDQSYLFYRLRNKDFQTYLVAGARGSANQASITVKSILDFSLDLPPLEEQKAIAAVLSAFDDKIELNRQMSATLEEMARALFKSWFMDFDPVRRNQAGQPSQPYDHLFPDRLVVDGNGRGVPEGWRIGKLADLVDFVKDTVRATPQKNQEKYVALDDMPQKSVNLAQFRSGLEVNSSIIRFSEGDILFGSMRPYFHKVGLAQFSGITRTTTFVLRPTHNFLRSFALLHCSSNEVIEYATIASVGTTIPYIKWDALSAYKILIPSEEALEYFQEVTEPMFTKIKANGAESRTLVDLRDTLLPRLMSGRLRVPG